MVIGVAAALWNEQVGDQFLQTLWLQCKNLLPKKRSVVDETDGGHLEEGAMSTTLPQICRNVQAALHREGVMAVTS